MSYVIATSRKWHESLAERLQNRCDAPFHLIAKRNELTLERLDEIKPRYVFFPHWSYIISGEIYQKYECVIFHMTDLPFGRGGSPLQNLIERGITETMLSAIRCVGELDAGPIYMKRPLSLYGGAEEIYMRTGCLIEEMVSEIVSTNPEPVEQTGESVVFKRRRPEQSEISPTASLGQLFDHIRMLDADGYPRAFLNHGRFRIELSRAALKLGKVIADVEITEIADD